MGNTTSTLTFNKLTSTDLGISQQDFNSISNTCVGIFSAQNVIDISNSNNVNLNINQQNEVYNLCLLQGLIKSSKDSKTVSGILDNLENKLQTTGGFPSANTTVSQYITNKMRTSLNQDTYNNVRQQCIVNMNTDNILKIAGSSGVNVTTSQVNNAYNQCIQNYAINNNIVSNTELQNVENASNNISTQGYDLISSLSKGISSIIGSIGNPYIILGIVLVFIIFFLFM